jgi:hypothetical protein
MPCPRTQNTQQGFGRGTLRLYGQRIALADEKQCPRREPGVGRETEQPRRPAATRPLRTGHSFCFASVLRVCNLVERWAQRAVPLQEKPMNIFLRQSFSAACWPKAW